MKKKLVVAAASLGMLGLALWISGIENVLHDMQHFPVWSVLCVMALLAANLGAVSFRLGMLLKHSGVKLPPVAVSRASVAGHVAGLFLMSLFGQVMGRQFVLHRYGVAPVLVTGLTALERMVLLLVSGVTGFFGASYILGSAELNEILTGVNLSHMMLVGLVAMLAGVYIGHGEFERRIFAGALSRAGVLRFLETSAITIVAQMLILSCFVVGVIALAPQANWIQVLAAAAAISFAASIPITVNGWGCRELAAVFFLGKLGIPASNAMAISVMVGICSTVVILAAYPIACRKPLPEAGPDHARTVGTSTKLDMQKLSAWVLAIATGVLVYFQAQVTIHGQPLTINLADPFAVLGLAAVMAHAIAERRVPYQKSAFGVLLAAFSVLVVLGFLHGVAELGVTQWALGGRLLGWLVLLGYVGVGHLTVQALGRHGLRRFGEVAAVTAAVVVLATVLYRAVISLYMDRWPDEIAHFQGFAGNRNAFAFQMLMSAILLLCHPKALDGRWRPTTRQDWLPVVLLGLVLAGLILSASRAGWGTLLLLLGLVWWQRFTDRRMLVASMIFAVAAWFFFNWGPSWLLAPSLDGTMKVGVQGPLSSEMSNQERMKTILHGFEMWRDAPILGAGLGVFFARSTTWFEQPIVIHCTPLWLLAEFGLLGTAVVSWPLWKMFRQHWKLRASISEHRMILCVLFIFVIFGLVHEIFYQRIFWLFLGALAATPALREAGHGHRSAA